MHLYSIFLFRNLNMFPWFAEIYYNNANMFPFDWVGTHNKLIIKDKHTCSGKWKRKTFNNNNVSVFPNFFFFLRNPAVFNVI